jgi:hypothetical protein
MFQIFFIIIVMFLNIYSLATYHWKGLEKNYNFVVENILIKIHMKKLQSKKFKYICSLRNMPIPTSNLSHYSFRHMVAPLGQLKLHLLREHDFSSRKIKFKLLPMVT